MIGPGLPARLVFKLHWASLSPGPDTASGLVTVGLGPGGTDRSCSDSSGLARCSDRTHDSLGTTNGIYSTKLGINSEGLACNQTLITRNIPESSHGPGFAALISITPRLGDRASGLPGTRGVATRIMGLVIPSRLAAAGRQPEHDSESDAGTFDGVARATPQQRGLSADRLSGSREQPVVAADTAFCNGPADWRY